MPRYRNTVGGSVVNIDDGLATRLGITENPDWEPLDAATSAPAEGKTPTRGKPARKPSIESEEAKDASGRDQDD